MKASALVWVRLNSVAVIAAAKPGIVRRFVAHLVGLKHRLKSLDDLEPHTLDTLNHTLSKISNDQLMARFLEFLREN